MELKSSRQAAATGKIVSYVAGLSEAGVNVVNIGVNVTGCEGACKPMKSKTL